MSKRSGGDFDVAGMQAQIGQLEETVADSSIWNEFSFRDDDIVIAIVAFDGKRVTDRNQLVVAIRARTVGETVKLTIERNGQRMDLSLTLQSSGS